MNFTLRNPGPAYNISFSGVIINSFYYNVTADGIYANQIIESSGFSEAMRVTPNGVVYLKGIKQINGGFSKRFEITPAGNLIAKSFTTQY